MPSAHGPNATVTDQSRFLLSSAAATFALGVSFALYRVSRQRPHFPFFRANTGHDPNFSPVLHAAKALGAGTALCVGSATVCVGLGSYLLDVHDLPSFAQRMRGLMRRTAVHERLKKDSVTDVEGEKEWDSLWEEGRQIDAERAEHKRRKKEASKGHKSGTVQE